MKQRERTTGKEQYYTPYEVALKCTQTMLAFASPGATWLEPAGGKGHFIDAMLNCGISKIASYDIEPYHPLIAKTDDFLKEDLSNLRNCVTLTNPPYGRANALSVPFFNKCAEVSDYIGFLVPKSWRKWSVINKLNRNFVLVHDEEIETNFIYDSDGEEKGMLKTVFQIWAKTDRKREKIDVADRGYIEKTTPQNADVSLTVFGRGCGTVKTDFPREPNTTQMFLKCREPWVVQALQKIDFSVFYNNVAFVEALSIKEINHLLNDYRDKSGTMLSLNTIHEGDCLELLKEVQDGSVQLTCFSPPYDHIRDYSGFEIDLTALGRELYRTTSPGGICACVINDGTKDFAKSLTTFRLAVDWVDKAGWKLFETVIYQRHGKPGGWWNKRFRVDHEYILIFLKGEKPRAFSKDHLMIPSKTAWRKTWSGSSRRTDGGLNEVNDAPINEMKCRGTVWSYNTSNLEGNKVKLQHPATFPDDLALDLIRCFSNEGDVVLDPTCGSGTTPVMAKKCGRKFIGMELSAEYVTIANTRLERETQEAIL